MSVDLIRLAEFIFLYAAKYRAAYNKAIAAPPDGPGYPALPISPYLIASQFEVFVATDGLVINQLGKEPKDLWYFAGGPAIMVDYEPTLRPPHVTAFLRKNGILGKPNGIYRIVSDAPLPAHIWRGRIQNIARKIKQKDKTTGISLVLHDVRGTLKEIVAALSFGAYGNILDIHIPTHESQIGEPNIFKDFGVFPADQNSRRFFTHLEIHGQVDSAAWDKRTINIRVQHDLRRDLTSAILASEKTNSGTMTFGGGEAWVEKYSNRLERLRVAMDVLHAALQNKSEEVEAVFHKIIELHPLLLDVYGTCESKPQFVYPNGTKSPIGKTSLEPDFLVSYSDQSYKLVELERPSKGVATAQGQPRSEVSQAVFQCAEWKHYIKTHYQQLHSRYPGIQARCKTAVVMSRTTQFSFKNIKDIADYKGLMMEQYNIDEFYTFDDLYERAHTAYSLLLGLAPDGIN
jgi:hypothetical protein